MRPLTTFMLLLAITATASAQVHTHIVQLPDRDFIILTIEDGKITSCTKPTSVFVWDQPPQPEPPQPGDLAAAAKAGLAAVAEYPQRESHLKAIAFLLDVIQSRIGTSSNTVAENVAKTRESCDAMTDATRWAPFWAAIIPHLNKATTNANLASNLETVAKALEDSMRLGGTEAAETWNGIKTYGLQRDSDFWKQLLEFIIKLLLEWLKE